MNLPYLVGVLRRTWLIIAIFALAGAAGSGAWTLLRTPTYMATSQAFVSIQSVSSVSDLSQGATFAQQVVKSYADVATSAYVLSPVIRQLGLHTTPAQLRQKVTAAAPTDTVILSITVDDLSPRRAASIADAITTRLSEVVSELSPETGSRLAAVRITRIESAGLSPKIVGPRPEISLIVGGLAGVLLAAAGIAVRERLDTRLHRPADLAGVADVPLLGAIRFDAEARSQPLAVTSDAPTRRAEPYRSLRASIEFVDFATERSSFVVTSSIASEGKSTTSANLALAVADAGKHVLLVDADLRRPRLAEYFGVDGSVGLTDVLIGRVSLDVAVQQYGRGSLTLLPAGTVPPNPGELIASGAMERLLDEIGRRYDVVIFDSPPLLPVADAAVLSRRTGGALVVCAAGRTRRHQLQGALGSLGQAQARVLGVVMTMLPKQGTQSRYGDYYGSGYSAGVGS